MEAPKRKTPVDADDDEALERRNRLEVIRRLPEIIGVLDELIAQVRIAAQTDGSVDADALDRRLQAIEASINARSALQELESARTELALLLADAENDRLVQPQRITASLQQLRARLRALQDMYGELRQAQRDPGDWRSRLPTDLIKLIEPLLATDLFPTRERTVSIALPMYNHHPRILAANAAIDQLWFVAYGPPTTFVSFRGNAFKTITMSTVLDNEYPFVIEPDTGDLYVRNRYKWIRFSPTEGETKSTLLQPDANQVFYNTRREWFGIKHDGGINHVSALQRNEAGQFVGSLLYSIGPYARPQTLWPDDENRFDVVGIDDEGYAWAVHFEVSSSNEHLVELVIFRGRGDGMREIMRRVVFHRWNLRANLHRFQKAAWVYKKSLIFWEFWTQFGFMFTHHNKIFQVFADGTVYTKTLQESIQPYDVTFDRQTGEVITLNSDQAPQTLKWYSFAAPPAPPLPVVYDPESVDPPQAGVMGRDLVALKGPFGWQLHTMRRFDAGEVVARYTGQLLDYRNARELPVQSTSHMRSLMPMRWVLDGSVTPDGVRITDPNAQLAGQQAGAPFANDARGQPGKQNNARFEYWDPPSERSKFERDPRKRILFLIATQAIPAGGEVLIDYGEDYWTRRGM